MNQLQETIMQVYDIKSKTLVALDIPNPNLQDLERPLFGWWRLGQVEHMTLIHSYLGGLHRKRLQLSSIPCTQHHHCFLCHDAPTLCCSYFIIPKHT